MPFYFLGLGLSMKRIANFLRVTSLWLLLLPGLIYFTGAASNQLVLIANHDTFPVLVNDKRAASVSPDGMLDGVHCLMTKRTHLNALADIFDFHVATYSIGDLLLEAGDWLWTFAPFMWLGLVIRRLTA